MFRASLCPSTGDRLNRTASGVSLDVLAAVVCSQNTIWVHCVNVGNTYIHAVHSARVLTTHYWSQHTFTQCTQLVSWLHTTAASTHSRSALSSCPDYTLPQPAHPG